MAFVFWVTTTMGLRCSGSLGLITLANLGLCYGQAGLRKAGMLKGLGTINSLTFSTSLESSVLSTVTHESAPCLTV